MKNSSCPYFATSSPNLLKLLLAVSCAILIFNSFGCRNEVKTAQAPTNQDLIRQAQKRGEVKVKVIENEPTLRGSQSVIGGIIQNQSEDRLDNISLSLELSRRGDGGKEVREVALTPDSLAPGEEGKYSLTVSNHDWASSKILKVKSKDAPAGVGFITEVGARRPPERMPDGKTIVIQKPKPKGEEFLNSPDDPDPIR